MSTILIADDRLDGRLILATPLRHQGYRVLEVDSAVRVIDTARGERPDRVISDILMPGMDGYERVRRLRADPATADVPVIVYTACYLEREAVALARACGVERILSKPSPRETLLAAAGAAPGSSAAPGGAAPAFQEENTRLPGNKVFSTVTEMRLANARLSSLIGLGRRLVIESDPHLILECFCQGAREGIGARFACARSPLMRRPPASLRTILRCAPSSASRRGPRRDGGPEPPGSS